MPHSPRLAVLLAAALLAGCGRAPQPVPAGQPWTDPGYVSAGGWSLYYSVLRAAELSPELAKEYGVASDPSGALVVVALTDAGHQPAPASTEVRISAQTLSGTARDVRVRRVEHDGAVSWLGEFTATSREILTFSVTARVDPASAPLAAQFRRELYGE